MLTAASRVPLLLAALAALVLLLAPARGDTAAVADAFAPTSEAPAGSTLANRALSATTSWRIAGDFTLSDPGVAASGTGSTAAWIPLHQAPDQIRVEARLTPCACDWAALALGQSADWGATFYGAAQLWVLVRPSGGYQLFAKGTALSLRSGTVPGWSSSNGVAQVVLTYARAGNTVSLTINNYLLVNALSLDDRDFVPLFDSAGVRVNAAVASASPAIFDDFSALSTWEASAPPAVRLANPLAVYAPGESIPAQFFARGLSATVTAANARARLVNLFGQTTWILSTATPCAVAEGVAQARLVVPPPGARGYHDLVIDFVTPAGAPLATARKPLAVVPAVDEAWRTGPRNPFGAMISPHTSYPEVDYALEARFMKRAGLRWVRTHHFNWTRAQSGPSAGYAWAPMDLTANRYRIHGLKIIATTGWPTPGWASDAHGIPGATGLGNYMPKAEYLDDAARFYRAMAARYLGNIAFYEIGNEVDAQFWRGTTAHYDVSDTTGIVGDYVSYFGLLADALRFGDHDARIAPGTTARMPEGVLYQPWLETALGHGLDEELSAFSTHYDGDLAKILPYFDPVLRATLPVIYTEIGGFARAAIPEPIGPGPEMKRIIKDDYAQFVRPLAHPNVEALCKFTLREELTYGGEGTLVAGLLAHDFTLRPTYVALATLARTLAGATFHKELNLVADSNTPGTWLEAFAFTDRDNRRVNVLLLHGGPSASVTLYSPDATLVRTDVMGNDTVLAVSSGRVTFTMDGRLPLLIRGRLDDAIAPPRKPTDHRVGAPVTVVLDNPSFESAPHSLNSVPGWTFPANNSDQIERLDFLVEADPDTGKNHLLYRTRPGQTTVWDGVMQNVPLGTGGKLPAPAAGQYLRLTVRVRVKATDVTGPGLGFTLTARNAAGTALGFTTNGYYGCNGGFDWRLLERTVEFPEWPAGTTRLTLELLLGGATGEVRLDDVELVGELMQHEPAGVPPAPVVALSAPDAQAGGSSHDHALLAFSRGAPGPDPLAVRFTAAGAASAGLHYSMAASPALIPAESSGVSIPLLPNMPALEGADRSATFTLAAGPGYRLGSPQQASVGFLRRDAWLQWTRDNLSPAEQADPLVSAPLASAAGDGAPNLLRAALGLSRAEACAAPAAGLDEQSRLTLTYAQLAGGSGAPGVDYLAGRLRYVVEASTTGLSAADWISGSAHLELVGAPRPLGDDHELVTVRLKQPAAPRAFLRLKVERE